MSKIEFAYEDMNWKEKICYHKSDILVGLFISAALSFPTLNAYKIQTNFETPHSISNRLFNAFKKINNLSEYQGKITNEVPLQVDKLPKAYQSNIG